MQRRLFKKIHFFSLKISNMLVIKIIIFLLKKSFFIEKIIFFFHWKKSFLHIPIPIPITLFYERISFLFFTRYWLMSSSFSNVLRQKLLFSWCNEFEELSVTETLELLSLSDKFLLQVQSWPPGWTSYSQITFIGSTVKFI